MDQGRHSPTADKDLARLEGLTGSRDLLPQPIPHKRLVDLNPEWTAFAPGRWGTALLCNCPCGCRRHLVVPLTNPLDDGPPDDRWPLSARWTRVGVTFAELTILGPIRITDTDHPGVHWHGFVAAGHVRKG